MWKNFQITEYFGPFHTKHLRLVKDKRLRFVLVTLQLRILCLIEGCICRVIACHSAWSATPLLLAVSLHLSQSRRQLAGKVQPGLFQCAPCH